eukprot:CAMPEP_0204821886 /NCGR_PEP_ID=MMETSP1346-20131115/89_1 /ASSEMBLY_ACC=CAM_ASM_000771 /TAXON_ID=215587 /ORGANISM="Aplanochytrium stocchinoi, Strain GSBS06" /LENGTH=180 /DNA_ID=CAMNT_0051947845 /DNA_START=453 /DNA_END=995 /DNA_ORIENTATION=-
MAENLAGTASGNNVDKLLLLVENLITLQTNNMQNNILTNVPQSSIPVESDNNLRDGTQTNPFSIFMDIKISNIPTFTNQLTSLSTYEQLMFFHQEGINAVSKFVMKDIYIASKIWHRTVTCDGKLSRFLDLLVTNNIDQKLQIALSMSKEQSFYHSLINHRQFQSVNDYGLLSQFTAIFI